MKVERALGILPPLEAIGPLRALILASSAPDEETRWGSAAAFLTVGKWSVSTDLLRRGIPQLVIKIGAHLSTLYAHYADALDAEEEGDPSQAAAHLLAAGRLEERVGRYRAAIGWAEVSLGIAEGLNTRKGEIETLIFLGRVARAQGLLSAAARHYQRALALAEAEGDPLGCIDASEGQGLVALAQGQLQGAAAWLGRAERLADGEEHEVGRARVIRELAQVAVRRGELDGAMERLATARAIFDRRGEQVEMALTLDAEGRLFLAQGKHAEAIAAFREALAWVQRAGGDPRTACGIRLHLAELYLALERMSEAEEEMRLAEKLALGHDLGRRLIQIYTRLGALRGRQGSEMGFVFFEQALALCKVLEPIPTLEAEVYHQYGLFKSNLGRMDEARAWLERARELLLSSGGGPSLELVESELEQIPA